jgi:predicted lipoprotein with Yx(FWY)xxD motif/plastocyanin
MVTITQTDKLGQFLVDDKGMTLYLYTKDTKNTSTCYDKCATAWPPLLTSGAPTGAAGVDASLLGTTTRTDGKMQVTYNGWPLYYWFKDLKAGDTTGQLVGGVWFVLSPKGDQIATPTNPTPAPTAAAGGQAAGQTVKVDLKNFAFAPKTLTVAPGTTVVWTNGDSAAHTVTADDGSFESGNLNHGATFKFTFSKAGTFAYYCTYHGGKGGVGMAGQIIVK